MPNESTNGPTGDPQELKSAMDAYNAALVKTLPTVDIVRQCDQPIAMMEGAKSLVTLCYSELRSRFETDRNGQLNTDDIERIESLVAYLRENRKTMQSCRDGLMQIMFDIDAICKIIEKE